jgi:hypothetical protein
MNSLGRSFGQVPGPLSDKSADARNFLAPGKTYSTTFMKWKGFRHVQAHRQDGDRGAAFELG